MKFHLADAAGLNQITAYGSDYVRVNDTVYRESLVVLPERLITDWPPSRFDGLEAAHFEMLAALDQEIVLLGTGERLEFPHPRLTAALARARVGLEVMDNGAACRTYNVLVAEGRKVAAALLLGPLTP